MGLLTTPATTLPYMFGTTILCHNSDTHRSPTVDRRGVLLGLGGLYGALAACTPSLALSPSMHHTHTHTAPTSEAIDYILPHSSSLKRVRRPAHLIDAAYISQFELGLQKMMELPEDHPWNLNNHAATHPPGIHDSWLFLPWHRLYIHFFERAIGRLVGEESFALPYWNFDSPDGMSIPSLFTANPSSPLHNTTRNPAHLPPAIIDLRYAYTSGDHTALTKDEQILDNLWQIGMTFRQSMALGPLFAGGPAKEGVRQYGGRFENLHKSIHQWVGPADEPYMDMGNPHTTSRDPIFYSLHANIDRLWDIYRGFRGNREEFIDPEWRDIVFTFYDENDQLVRAKVEDCLNSSKLGYTYEQAPLPWAGRLPNNTETNTWKNKATLMSLSPINEFGPKPRLVDASSSPVRVMVTRPKDPLTKEEKQEWVEVLHIKGIEVIPGQPTRFDVFVSKPYNGEYAGPGYGIFAGNFIKPHVIHPRNHMKPVSEKLKEEPKKKEKKGGLKLGLGPLIEALSAESDEKLVVTFVPRDGKVVLDGVGVEMAQTDGSLLI